MDRRYRDADFLRRRHVERGQSASDIADECGVTASTVSRWLSRHGIERDPRYKDEGWLFEQYVERGRRQQDIADDCDVTKSTISHLNQRGSPAVHGRRESRKLRRANNTQQPGQLPIFYKHKATGGIQMEINRTAVVKLSVPSDRRDDLKRTMNTFRDATQRFADRGWDGDDDGYVIT